MREENPSLSQPEVFKLVAERWRHAKEQTAQISSAQGSVSRHEASMLEASLVGLHL